MISDEAGDPLEGNLDAQIAELTVAISGNPNDARAHRQRGLLKARMRRHDEALSDFNRALALDPNDAHAYGLRGLVLAKKGKLARALGDFDHAIRLAPQNAELYRSHRERVLSDPPSGPLAGGDFNILKNPFVLLGLPLTAKPATVKEAYEDAVEDEVDEADALMRAQQTLLTPRLRIDAEVGGFLDVDPRLAMEIVKSIRSGRPIRDVEDKLRKLHSLPRSNVIAHFGSAQALGMDGLSDLISAQAAVVPGAVCDAINDVREEIGLGRVDRDVVSEALSKLLDRQTKAVIEKLDFNAEAVGLFDRFVSKIADGADSPTLFRLDVYVKMFAQITTADLSKRSEAVDAVMTEIKTDPKRDASYLKLRSALEHWISLLRPVQTYEDHRQREDTTTREMYAKVRDLALYLSNEQSEFESAGKVVAVASEIFGHLSRATPQMTDDAKKLVELQNNKLADDLLTPLLQACEEANQSHRTIESELLRYGFGPGSTGSVKDLFDKFVAAVKSAAKTSFSDAPWRLVRSVALSLNNDSSAPRAAEKLIQGLLDFAQQIPTTAEMSGLLREDKRVIRKNQTEEDLAKSLEAKNWKDAERLSDQLLTLETSEDKLRVVRTIHQDAAAKRKSGRRVLWFFGIIAGIIIVAWANSDSSRPRTAGYQPPSSYRSATVQPSATARPATPDLSNTFVPVDTSETMPPVGTGLTLTRSNIRYCSYQRTRLEGARPMINTDVQGQRFNAAINDYNSRCTQYRYRQSDKDAVETELLGKQWALEAEGRSLAISWRRTSHASPRGNR